MFFLQCLNTISDMSTAGHQETDIGEKIEIQVTAAIHLV